MINFICQFSKILLKHNRHSTVWNYDSKNVKLEWLINCQIITAKVANLMVLRTYVPAVKPDNFATGTLQVWISGPRNSVPAYFNPWANFFTPARVGEQWAKYLRIFQVQPRIQPAVIYFRQGTVAQAGRLGVCWLQNSSAVKQGFPTVVGGQPNEWHESHVNRLNGRWNRFIRETAVHGSSHGDWLRYCCS